MQTRPTLQLLDYDTVYAAGDVAQIANNERPKAGVFAVVGPVLARNIRALLAGKQLYHYRPQQRYLALVGLEQTGNCHPWQVFSKGRMALDVEMLDRQTVYR